MKNARRDFIIPVRLNLDDLCMLDLLVVTLGIKRPQVIRQLIAEEVARITGDKPQ